MDAALLAVILALVALLGGCLWYVLARVGARLDKLEDRLDRLDGRLRAVEDTLARMDTSLTALTESVGRVLDTLRPGLSRP